MIKHIWSVFCKESIVSADTNNISISNSYENLQFDLNTDSKEYKKGGSVGVPFDFEIVSLFYRDNTKKEETIEEHVAFIDPKGNKLGEFTADVVFKAGLNRMRNRFKFNTLALTTSGTYIFQMYIQKKRSETRELVAAIPVDIDLKINGEQL